MLIKGGAGGPVQQSSPVVQSSVYTLPCNRNKLYKVPDAACIPNIN